MKEQPMPASEQQLEALLTEPTESTVEAVRQLAGDLLILGAGGKMGPSLAILAQRSIQSAGLPFKVRCVSRFRSPETAEMLKSAGIDVIPVDLLTPGALESLPDAPNVAYLVGMKFGSTGAEPLTWMLNTFLPGLVAQRFRSARIVALSTGNVYPLVPVTSGGATEDTPPAPLGEYGQSCLGRERMFQYAALSAGTYVSLLRLSYANDLRYGVLHDVARYVYNGEPVDLQMGNASVIWQGDANRVILQSFGICASPASILNVTGPEIVSIRWLAERFAGLFHCRPVFIGEESGSASISNASLCCRLFGYPAVTLDQMVEMTAHWIKIGGRSLSKPTHFETLNGKY